MSGYVTMEEAREAIAREVETWAQYETGRIGGVKHRLICALLNVIRSGLSGSDQRVHELRLAEIRAGRVPERDWWVSRD